MARLEQILRDSTNEMFFSRRPILVEGREDIAYLTSYLMMTDRWQDFRKAGCHFISVDGKTNMARPLALGQELSIPMFCIFDADTHATSERQASERINRNLLDLLGVNAVGAWPDETYYGDEVVMWCRTIEKEVKASIGDANWLSAVDGAKASSGFEQGVSMKNPLLVASIVERLVLEGVLPTSLEKASASLMNWANQSD